MGSLINSGGVGQVISTVYLRTISKSIATLIIIVIIIIEGQIIGIMINPNTI